MAMLSERDELLQRCQYLVEGPLVVAEYERRMFDRFAGATDLTQPCCSFGGQPPRCVDVRISFKEKNTPEPRASLGCTFDLDTGEGPPRGSGDQWTSATSRSPQTSAR